MLRQPMDAHDGEEMHLQAMEEPTVEKVDPRMKSVGSQCRSRILQSPADQSREECMLEQVSW